MTALSMCEGLIRDIFGTILLFVDGLVGAGSCRSTEDTWALRPANLVTALNVSRLKTRSVGRGLGSRMKTFCQK